MKISHAVSRVRARQRPHPAHLPMRRGGRSRLRPSLRPRLRPSLRPTLQLAMGPDRHKRRWQRRLPARRLADISTLHLGRDMKCNLAAPMLLSIVAASSLAPFALGAVAIASALATQRLDTEPARRGRHGRGSRGRTGARTDRRVEKAGCHPAPSAAVGLPEATAEIIASLGEHRDGSGSSASAGPRSPSRWPGWRRSRGCSRRAMRLAR